MGTPLSAGIKLGAYEILAAIGAGVLAANATMATAQSVWDSPAFLAGRVQEDRVICDLIREIFGNVTDIGPKLLHECRLGGREVC